MSNADKKFLTDLTNPFGETMIFQPVITAGMQQFADVTRIYRSEHFEPELDRCIWEIVHSMMESNCFVHVGKYTYSSETLVRSGFEPCGGFGKATPNTRGELSWGCDKCEVSVRFHHVRHDDVPDALLHLLLKQMVPFLRSGNYLWTPETGVVGVMHDALAYQTNSQTPGYWYRANFGFTFMPGMQTLETPSGFEEWLRYLVQIKFDQLRAKAGWQLPGLIGPEHHGMHNGGLRFWRR